MDALKKILLAAPLSESVFDRLATAANRNELCANRHLTDRQWRALWRAKLPVDPAVALVSRTLDAERIELVLQNERRPSVLAVLCTHNALTTEQLHALIALRPSESFLGFVMRNPSRDASVLEAAAAHLTGTDRLDWCVNNPSVSDDETFAAVLGVSEVSKSDLWRRSRLITKAIHSRPGMIARLFALDELPDAVCVALAGSRLNTNRTDQLRIAALDSEYAALALVANPVVPVDVVDSVTVDSYKVKTAIEHRKGRGASTVTCPYEEIDDPDQLVWTVRRALPTRYKPDGRPHDLVALALNPNLDDDFARRILEVLNDTATAAAADVNRATTHLAARLGVTPPDPVSDAGFWTYVAQTYTGHIERLESTLLDPEQRPWTDEQMAAALDGIDPFIVERVKSLKMASIEYTSHDVVYTLVLAELGDHPARIEMLLNLAPSHLGDFASLLAAVRKLAR